MNMSLDLRNSLTHLEKVQNINFIPFEIENKFKSELNICMEIMPTFEMSSMKTKL